MGKTYIDTVKYIIYADYEVDGIVEKPDIVGAIFGQTEGLLGEGLDLRELQKGGRIGRIEVTTINKDGKTAGVIEIPSSLDKVNTSVLAAGVEAVDRVGPCEARIKITKIDDTRTNKRQAVISRAQELLKGMMIGNSPDSKEISDTVREESKTAEVVSYGPEQLAAGPEAETAKEIIIVEGRADVISVLRAGIKNVICLQGKKIPPSVIELVKNKEVTVFVDGDRGGDLILRQLAISMRIAFVAKAPDGKEVEELTQKEILKCLKKTMTFPEYMKTQRFSSDRPVRRTSENYESRPPMKRETHYERRESYPRYSEDRFVKKENPFAEKLKTIEGSFTALLLNEKNEPIKQVEVKDMRKEIEATEGIQNIVFDGVITQGLIDLAAERKIKNIAGMKKGKVKELEGVSVYTLY